MLEHDPQVIFDDFDSFGDFLKWLFEDRKVAPWGYGPTAASISLSTIHNLFENKRGVGPKSSKALGILLGYSEDYFYDLYSKYLEIKEKCEETEKT